MHSVWIIAVFTLMISVCNTQYKIVRGKISGNPTPTIIPFKGRIKFKADPFMTEPTVATKLVGKKESSTQKSSLPFQWRHSHERTPCSKTCGNGIQKSLIHCHEVVGNKQVDESLCKARRPIPEYFLCNMGKCPPTPAFRWGIDKWQECDAKCGPGSQTRDVQCTNSNGNRVHNNFCNARNKPISARSCSGNYCPEMANWRLSPWQPCSASCGQGAQERVVSCVSSITNATLSNEECRKRSSRPVSIQACNLTPCSYSWLVSKWSIKCTEEDGALVQHRKVICENRDRCELSRKPAEKRPCNKDNNDAKHNKLRTTCPKYSWFTSPWSPCSVTCGEGIQLRVVACIHTKDDQPTSIIRSMANILCRKKMPPRVRPCMAPSCESSRWYVARWSPCSVTCGQGKRTRKVYCLDSKKMHDNSCDMKKYPNTKRMCRMPLCNQQDVLNY